MQTTRPMNCAALAFMLLVVSAANGALPPAAQFHFRDPSRQSLPAWIHGLSQTGGRFTGTPVAWTVDPSAPAETGTLSIGIDRRVFHDDLLVGVIHTPNPGLRWTARISDDSGKVHTADLTSNLVSRSKALEVDTFIVPLSKYPASTRLAISRLAGEMKIHGVILQPLPAALREDAATQSELTLLFGDATTVEAVRQSLARSETPFDSGPDAPTDPVAAAGSTGRTPLIETPRDGARVLRTIPMSGHAPKIPEGHHLYVFLSMGPDFWPKGEEIVPIDGKWRTVVRHGGHDEASFSLGLYDVSPEAHARFQTWRTEAKRTGKYPPLKDMSGTERLSRVRVKVLPD